MIESVARAACVQVGWGWWICPAVQTTHGLQGPLLPGRRPVQWVVVDKSKHCRDAVLQITRFCLLGDLNHSEHRSNSNLIYRNKGKVKLPLRAKRQRI